MTGPAILSLAEHDAWANRRIAEACARLTPADADRKLEGMHISIRELLDHLVQVERVYLKMMFERQLRDDGEDLATNVAMLPELGDAYLEAVRDLGAADLDRSFHIPWFERDFTVREGLLQVFTHSAEHRADLSLFLSRFGIQAPGMDYIMYVYERDGGVIPE